MTRKALNVKPTAADLARYKPRDRAVWGLGGMNPGDKLPIPSPLSKADRLRLSGAVNKWNARHRPARIVVQENDGKLNLWRLR